MADNEDYGDSQATLLDTDALPDAPAAGGTSEKQVLDGLTVTIKDVQLSIMEGEEKTTKKGTQTYRSVMCYVFYDDESESRENYGGIRQYKEKDGSWGEPVIWLGGTNRAVKLFKLWCAKTGKNPEEVSMKEFAKGLIGMSGKIKTKTVEFGDKEYTKNLIEEFI